MPESSERITERRPARRLLWLLAFSLLLQAGSAAAQSVVRPRLAQDGAAFDLILRNSDDPDLLSARQAVLRQKLLRLGVDPTGPGRPTLESQFAMKLYDRVKLDPHARPRSYQKREIDWERGIVVVFELDEGTLFDAPADTNLVGIAFHEARDLSDSTLAVSVHGLEGWQRYWVSDGLEQDWALAVSNYQAQLAGGDGSLNFRIPIKIPRTLERIIGRGDATSIHISGTETIRIGGQSTVRNDFIGNEIQQNQSLFPSLEMEQTLRVNLDGTVGEKIKVRVTHNSAATFGQEATEVKLEFVGDEDDIVQSIRAGNIDVTLPGSGLLGVPASRGGLFGIRVSGAVGALDYTVFTSKEQSQQGKTSFNASGGTPNPFTLNGADYIKDQFFRFNAPFSLYFQGSGLDLSAVTDGWGDVSSGWQPDWEIDHSSIELYRSEDRPTVGEDAVTEGIAVLDSTGIGWEGPGSPLDLASLGTELENYVRYDNWIRLRSGQDWEPLYDGDFNIIGVHVNTGLLGEALAAAYNIVDGDGNVVRKVGRRAFADPEPTIPDPDGGESEVYFFKLIQPREGEIEDPFVEGEPTAFALTWEYVYRNFYDLGGAGISPDNISLRIQPASGGDPDFPDQDSRLDPWISHFGLDETGPDGSGEPDDLPDFDNVFIFRLDQGLLQFPTFTPFALESKDLAPEDAALFDGMERLYQTSKDAELQGYRKFIITGSHTSTSSRLNLRTFNLKEGSEEVILNGRTLTRGTDYDIDYFAGEITLTGAASLLDAQSNLEVRYEVDPLFGGGRTSLHGIHLGYELGDQKRVNTTWLLNAQPTAARKPRFGEEPNRTWVGNLSTKLRFTPFFLTRIANWLPRVNEREASVINFDAEVAVSIPNPNTLRAAYLEDFEAADNDITLPMSRSGWMWASLPALEDTIASGRQFGVEDRVFTRWHRQQPSVKREELNPTLSERERNDIVQTLAMRMISNDAIDNPASPQWQPDEYGGIMRGFPGRVDLSQVQFLEFWINDFSGDVDPALREGKLHFDFGTINEDFWWAVTDSSVEIGKWDREDDSRDGDLNGGEDRGLDQVANGEQGKAELRAFPVLRSLSSTDAGADDFDSREEFPEFDADPVLRNEPFLYINGTEGNRALDDEDLDRSGDFNRRDGYFTVTLDLSDPDPLVDVYRDYASYGDFLADQRSKRNAWRKYRIDLRGLRTLRAPVDPDFDYTVAQPDLSRVSHFRIWYENPDLNAPVRKHNPTILFADMKFIGNRWLSEGLRDSLNNRLDPAELGQFEDFRVGVLNNKDNPDYRPPVFPDTRNNIAEKEQSLQLNYSNLQEGHGARIRQDLLGSLTQDLLLYEQLAYFWRAPHDENGVRDVQQDGLEAFYWVGSDSTNYYEIALRFSDMQVNADGWQECRIDFGELTNIKFEDSFPVDQDSTIFLKQGFIEDTQTGEPYRVTVRGTPDLRRVKNYYAGIRNPSGSGMGPISGDVLFNEIRLTHVDKNVGYAKRLSLSSNIKGIGNVGFTWDETDPSFRGLDSKRGSQVERRSWSGRAGSSVQRLIPTLGFDIPISGQIRKSSSLPRYQTNTDIELLDDALRQAEKSTNENRSFNLQLRRPNPSDRWWLRHTIDRISFGMNASRSRNETPVNLTRRSSSQQKYTYDLRVPAREAELTVPFIGWKFRYLPNQLSIDSSWNFDETRNSQKVLNEDGTRSLVDRPVQLLKKNRNRFTIIQSFAPNLRATFNMNSDRDLARRDEDTGEIQKQDLFGLFNIGKEDNYSQSLNFNYQPQLPVLRWFSPDIQYNTRYSEDRKPGIRQRAPNTDSELLGEAGQVRHVNNGAQLSFRGKAGLTSWVKQRVRSWKAGRARKRLEEEEAARAAVADSVDTAPEPGAGLPDLPPEQQREIVPGEEGELPIPAASDSVAAESFNPLKATGNLFKPFARLISDLEPFNLNLNLNRGSSFRHVNNRANLAYRFGWIVRNDAEAAGFTEPVAPGQAAFSNSGRRREWSINVTTRSSLSDDIRVDTSYLERRSQQRNDVAPPRESFNREFPQFKLTVNNVQNWRVFRGWFQQASMNLTAKKTEAYQSTSGTDKFPKISWSWQPRWNMSFHNGLTSSLNFQISRDRQNNTVNLIERSNFRTNVSMQKSFDAHGFLGFLRFGREGVGSNIDMTFDASFTQNRNSSTPLRATTRTPTKNGRRSISFSPRFNYQFSRNLRGGMELQYTRNTDLEGVLRGSDASGTQRPVTQSFGLFFNATLNF